MHLPLNRGIQLSSSNMCGDTVEFCMRMHFGRDFLVRESGCGGGRGGGGDGGGGGVFPSVSSVAIVRNFSVARLTPEKLHLESDVDARPGWQKSPSVSIIRARGCHLLKFRTVSLSRNVCRDSPY